ncbi:hypothetical protein N0X72_12880 [Streptomyces carpaticus]|uniref:Uncharacterized protein n=2 Tax=Streptomyces TaxID=1883 RepID=A0A1I6TIW0_9ACTN|nr:MULTISPECIES: hypothetical protein [Streptomyces]QKV67323.1 hypothetical protein HUT13_12075 [Streptomyces harbinensis]UWM52710.1 hypothetical protein N0X72_12880 [Streptomyces carpaticus]SFS89115.1 hypothetical protein SAMN05444716_104689 [Streptomyces harbinensis]
MFTSQGSPVFAKADGDERGTGEKEPRRPGKAPSPGAKPKRPVPTPAEVFPPHRRKPAPQQPPAPATRPPDKDGGEAGPGQG